MSDINISFHGWENPKLISVLISIKQYIQRNWNTNAVGFAYSAKQINSKNEMGEQILKIIKTNSVKE